MAPIDTGEFAREEVVGLRAEIGSLGRSLRDDIREVDGHVVEVRVLIERVQGALDALREGLMALRDDHKALTQRVEALERWRAATSARLALMAGGGAAGAMGLVELARSLLGG